MRCLNVFGFVRFPLRFAMRFGGVLLSHRLCFRGGRPDELVLSQIAEFLGNPSVLPSLRLVRKFSITVESL